MFFDFAKEEMLESATEHGHTFFTAHPLPSFRFSYRSWPSSPVQVQNLFRAVEQKMQHLFLGANFNIE